MSVVNGFQVGSDTLKYNYESLENYNTPEFSASSTYNVGDYVMHEGKLYRCTTQITTAAAWDSSKWTAAVLANDVRDNSADCDGLVDHLIEVTDTEPTSDYNQIWIPETLPSGVQVPTYTEFTALEDRVDDVEEAVASVETSTTASKAYAVGDYFWKDDVLYVVTAAIASGGTITVNTNCKAAVLGNDVSSLKSALSENTRNIWSGKNTYSGTGYNNSGVYYIAPGVVFPAGTYTLSGIITSNDTYATTSLIGIYDSVGTTYTSTYRIYQEAVARGVRFKITFTATKAFSRFMFCASSSATNSSGDTLTVSDIQLETGSIATPYIPPVTATDFISREFTPLQSTGDSTDRTQEILLALNTFGFCTFGKGDFYTSGITMPDNTMLKGQGNATKLYLADSSIDSAIVMGDNCSISDFAIVGASDALTLDGDIVGIPTENENATNVWGEGDVSISSDPGWVHKVLQTPINAGVYRLSVEVTSNAPTDSYIGFSTSETGSISSSNIVASTTFVKGSRKTQFIIIPTTVYSVRLCSGVNPTGSNGYSATWANIRMTLVHSRSGIKWADATVKHGTVRNCRISKFDCAGIILQDTGTPTNHNLAVSDVFITGCNVGIYVRKNSEFNKFVNCTLVGNYYGYLNRGGNNDISNSGIDSNVVNAQIDADEGSNNGHGLICGCSLNHADSNTGYSLIVKGTGRMLITACNIYYGKTLFSGTNGNIMNGCGFGNSAPINITNGQCNIIANCMIKSASDTPITLTNNTASQIVNCYTRDGDAVTPV